MRLLSILVFLAWFVLPTSAQSNADPALQLRQELWVSQFKESLRRKPEVLAYLAASRVVPNQAWTNKKLYDAFNALDSRARALPGAGAGYSIVIDLYKDSVGHPYDNWLGKVKEYYRQNPEKLDQFARETYNELIRTEALGSDAAPADVRFRDIIKAEAGKNDGFVYVDAKTSLLYEKANQNTVSTLLVSSINNFSESEFRKVLENQDNLKKYLEANFKSDDEVVAAFFLEFTKLSDDQKKVLEWVAEKRAAADIEAEVTRQTQAVEEFRSATFVLGSILGLADRKVGNVVTGMGPALLQAHRGISSLVARGFSWAATGDVVSAGLAVQSLLSGYDPAAERHAQIMKALGTVIERLDLVIERLAVMESHLVAIREDLRLIGYRGSVSAADARSRLVELNSAITAYFDYALQVESDDIGATISGRERACVDQIEQNVTGRISDEMRQRLVDCLSYSATDALERSLQSSWLKSTIGFDSDTGVELVDAMRRRGEGVEYYPAALAWAQQMLTNNGFDLTGLPAQVYFNAPMWERGVRNHLAVRYAVPDLKPVGGTNLAEYIRLFTVMGQNMKAYTDQLASLENIERSITLHRANVAKFMAVLHDVTRNHLAVVDAPFVDRNVPLEILLGWELVGPRDDARFDPSNIQDVLWAAHALGLAETRSTNEYMAGVDYVPHEKCSGSWRNERVCDRSVWAQGYHICRGSTFEIVFGDQPPGYFGKYQAEQCRSDNFREVRDSKENAELAALAFFDYMHKNVQNHLAGIRFAPRQGVHAIAPDGMSVSIVLSQDKAAEAWDILQRKLQAKSAALSVHLSEKSRDFAAIGAQLNMSAIAVEALVDTHYGTCAAENEPVQELLTRLQSAKRLQTKLGQGLVVDRDFLQEMALDVRRVCPPNSKECTMEREASLSGLSSKFEGEAYLWKRVKQSGDAVSDAQCIRGVRSLEQGLGWLAGWTALDGL